MKKIILAFILFVFTNASFSQTTKDQVVGDWWNDTKEGKVQIYKQGDKYFGKLIWTKNPRKDVENPDAKLKTRDLVGITLLKNFTYNGKTWEDGTIYDPKNGKTYSCIIKAKSIDVLDIRGFIGFSLLGRSTAWTRVK